MYNQFTSELIKCHYCNSSDMCAHLIATYDETFDSLQGGLLFEDKYVQNILSHFFIHIIKKHGFSYKLNQTDNHFITKMWNEIVTSKNSYLINDMFDECLFELPSQYKYMLDKLDTIIFPEYGEFEGGPGQSSSYKIYYHDNPVEVIARLKLLINSEIEDLRNSL